ncbi:spermatogenesis-associated protein 20 isoform X2 [Bacillus rossius redtenbacheri]|uniref:spermatogenesis-associated protein 20 isoform X2 n=1 Tax=Bacillus rossius redtenbacheri TaxID=93214 RepID=UPI002FDD8B36
MILGILRQCTTIRNLIKRPTIVPFYKNISLLDTTCLSAIKRCHLEFRWLHRSMATGGDNTVTSKHQNRLAYERSPYLLQHATNPVEWYPWGNEAFEKARQEDKLIFLSVGYSTCHWCHVMERESFENEEIAKVMNEHFVNIKVDREERPDVDKIYMTFVQATSGHGGWPMSVFLTPALQPIMGGTYFPPEDQWHRPGFRTMLLRVVQQWKDNRQKFAESGAKVIDVLKKTTTLDVPLALSSLANSVPSPDCGEKCLEQLSRSFEPQFGGFGLAPKFPQPVNFNFLFHVYGREPDSEAGKRALDMCLHTLKMMAKGGIHDHVSQGFARYSTDERWHVPHFEKMLYDQAQLAVAYSTAFLATGDEFYADIVRDILQYVGRDLSDKSGGFYSAEDADSYPTHDAKHKKEGAFCVWTYDDVQRLLNKQIEDCNFTLADIFCYHYDIKPQGNVNPNQDPHSELRHQNVLIVTGSEEETAEKYGLALPAARAALEEGRRVLFEARQKRPRPHLDDKMLTAWNGLMISGYAKAGQVLKDSCYIDRAIKAANFVKKHLYNPTAETLLRSCYRGSDGNIVQISAPISGFVDDYAFLIRGLLDLYEACFDPSWVEWAETLQDQQDRLFWDEEGAGYFTSPASDPSILIRLKEDQDGAEPSGNSVSAHNLQRLGALLDRQELQDRAARLLAAFTSRLTRVPVALPELTSALLVHHDAPTQVFVTGRPEDPDTAALLEAVQSCLVAGRVLALADGRDRSESVLYRKCEVIRRMKPAGGRAAAYVCRRRACSLPATAPAELRALLSDPASCRALQ